MERCRAAGLVWGRELYIDATKVEADAAVDSLNPRFYVEAHLERLFGTDAPAADANPRMTPVARTGARRPPAVANGGATGAGGRVGDGQRRPPRVDRARGAPGPGGEPGHYQRMADLEVSTTDPDATLMPTQGGAHLGYKTHYVVDGGKARIVVAALVTPAEVMENQPALDLLWRSCFRWRSAPGTSPGTPSPAPWRTSPPWSGRASAPTSPSRTGGSAPPSTAPASSSSPPPATCTSARRARPSSARGRSTPNASSATAPAAICNACPAKAACTPGRLGRVVHRSFDEAYLDRVRGYHATEAYAKALRKRAVWVEPLFGEAKQWHGLRRFRLRGLPKVNGQALLTAAGQNLKRLLRRRGWGRRPWPGCPAGALRSRRRRGPLARFHLIRHSW